jgi:hypothetical protein
LVEFGFGYSYFRCLWCTMLWYFFWLFGESKYCS